MGLVAAATAVGAAAGLRYLHRRGMPGSQIVVLALVAIATIRSVASIWLPHIGSGLTRQHETSFVIAVVALIAFVVLRIRMQRDARPATS